MLNINMGHNKELMQKCRRLWEYASFVEQVNQNLDSGYSMERAVNTAIDTCILLKSRSEVLLMFLTEYDEKLHMENTFEEGRETGFEQGKQQILLLSQMLLNENRIDDLKKAYTDEQYLESLLLEFHLEKPEIR